MDLCSHGYIRITCRFCTSHTPRPASLTVDPGGRPGAIDLGEVIDRAVARVEQSAQREQH